MIHWVQLDRYSSADEALNDGMMAYLEKVKAELQYFYGHEFTYIGREDNTNVDALARLAISKDTDLLHIILVEVIPEPNITKQTSVEVID